MDDQRRKSVLQGSYGVVRQTRYYLGDYEEEVDALGNIRKIHYLGGGAVLIRSFGRDSLLYGYADYQGSLIALTNESGTVLEDYAYDPWGLRRNPDDWSQSDTRTHWRLNRGYTGHEHLDLFGIINMNGRVYDPVTGMFFSPDPQLQDPENWLNYNRYGYCLNNPLIYTDPSGESFILTALAALATLWILTSDDGYELQKAISPIAIHYDIHMGSDKKFLGMEISVGKPQLSEGNRYNVGFGYYWDDYGDDGVTSANSYEGLELSYGKEYSSGWNNGYCKMSHIHYDRGGKEFDQDWDKLSVVYIPGLWYMEFGNDCNLHDIFSTSSMPNHVVSDKLKTAEFEYHFFGLNAGLILCTGTPDEGRLLDEGPIRLIL